MHIFTLFVCDHFQHFLRFLSLYFKFWELTQCLSFLILNLFLAQVVSINLSLQPRQLSSLRTREFEFIWLGLSNLKDQTPFRQIHSFVFLVSIFLSNAIIITTLMLYHFALLNGVQNDQTSQSADSFRLYWAWLSHFFLL